MSSFDRKIKKNNEINDLKVLFGKTPKHRCAECHKMTLYNKKGQCIHCSGEYKKVKEKYDKYLNKIMKKVKNETVV